MGQRQMLESFNAHALVIGVGTYKHIRFRNLPETVNDANAIAGILYDPKCCGYNPANVKCIINRSATGNKIRKALQKLAGSTDINSTVFIYFSGHGGQAYYSGDWHTYLCPGEADPNNLEKTAIPGEEFSALIASIPAQKILVIIDTCHAGGAAEPRSADRNSEWRSGLPSNYYEILSQGSGRVIMASSKENQLSYTRPQRDFGIFTWYLCEALRGKAAIRGDGLVHVLDVWHYVSERVQQDEERQTPILKVKDMELNFPIALHQGGEREKKECSDSKIADIREQIIRDAIEGAKLLSDYLKGEPRWVEKRNEVDLKRNILVDIRKRSAVFGQGADTKIDEGLAIYHLLYICSELEKFPPPPPPPSPPPPPPPIKLKIRYLIIGLILIAAVVYYISYTLNVWDIQHEINKLQESNTQEVRKRGKIEPFDVWAHFTASGFMGDIEGEGGRKYINFFEGWSEEYHSAPVAIKVTYIPGPIGYTGIYWQNKPQNWGDLPGDNFQSSGYKNVTFWAKGEKGGEVVEFKAGGINQPGKPYRDSFDVDPLKIVLEKDWKQYTLELEGMDLSSVIGGFCFTASESANPEGLTFYLDDIYYEF